MSDYDDAVAILKNNHWTHNSTKDIWESPISVQYLTNNQLVWDPKVAIRSIGFDWDDEMKKLISSYVPPNSITARGSNSHSAKMNIWEDGYQTHPTFKKDEDCAHDWVDYVGLNETYRFCRRCDKKRT